MRTRYYFPEEARTLEENTMPSETQPEDVMTITEMLNRHVQGLPIDGGNGFSDFPEELGYIPDDINSLDLVEIDELRQAVNARFEELQAQARNGSEADTEGKRPAPPTEEEATNPPKQPTSEARE
ncbi:MAG: hypothetical protein QXN95_05310 [Candidatus Bathyarchaeia archaeon]